MENLFPPLALCVRWLACFVSQLQQRKAELCVRGLFSHCGNEGWIRWIFVGAFQPKPFCTACCEGAHLTDTNSLVTPGIAIPCTEWHIQKWGWVCLLHTARLYSVFWTASAAWIPKLTCGNFQWERSSDLAAGSSDRLELWLISAVHWVQVELNSHRFYWPSLE